MNSFRGALARIARSPARLAAVAVTVLIAISVGVFAASSLTGLRNQTAEGRGLADEPSLSAAPTPRNTPESTASPAALSPSESASPLATASSSPTGTDGGHTGSTTELDWTEAGVFGNPDGAAVVHDMAVTDAGLVAVGVEYEQTLPVLGPVSPHDGRVWISTDGDSWEDVTPPGTFANVALEHVFMRAGGTLVAYGGISTASDIPGGVEGSGSGYWQSSDGRSWEPASRGLPEGALLDLAHGERGYLAHVIAVGATHGSDLWFSSDGTAWEQVRQLTDGLAAIGAGDEGFAVVGQLGYYGDQPEPFAIASGDGRAWIQSAHPPTDVAEVAPVGGDWVAVGVPQPGDSMSTWSSANGLDWRELGDTALGSFDAEGGTCYEIPIGLDSAGPWLVSRTVYSHPCSEGAFVIHSTQRISVDGRSWTALPFETGTPGIGSSGTAIHAAAASQGRLILAGEVDGRAVFWSGTGQ